MEEKGEYRELNLKKKYFQETEQSTERREIKENCLLFSGIRLKSMLRPLALMYNTVTGRPDNTYPQCGEERMEGLRDEGREADL